MICEVVKEAKLGSHEVVVLEARLQLLVWERCLAGLHSAQPHSSVASLPLTHINLRLTEDHRIAPGFDVTEIYITPLGFPTTVNLFAEA